MYHQSEIFFLKTKYQVSFEYQWGQLFKGFKHDPHFLELNGVLQGFKRWKRKIKEKVHNYLENVFKSHIYSPYPSWFFLLLMLLHKAYLILKALLRVFIKFFIIFFFLHDHHEKFHNCCLFQCSHQQPLQ